MVDWPIASGSHILTQNAIKKQTCKIVLVIKMNKNFLKLSAYYLLLKSNVRTLSKLVFHKDKVKKSAI